MSERDEFVEILQAKAADLLTRDEARSALRRSRPDWFRTAVVIPRRALDKADLVIVDGEVVKDRHGVLAPDGPAKWDTEVNA